MELFDPQQLDDMAVLSDAPVTAKDTRRTCERIAVVGLGYVGLPLALKLSQSYSGVIGYDLQRARITQLQSGKDSTGAFSADQLARSDVQLSGNADSLAAASAYLVTVPTPVDRSNRPDLTALRAACRTIGAYLRPGDLVVVESTVYPGATEEVCGPELAAASGLAAGRDFALGYSPERINPGDRENTIDTVAKIVAGDTPKTLNRVARIYETITRGGLHRCSSIKVAETAKVIENSQRDLNIALANEIAKICHLMEIPTSEVIEAAATKWNFVPYSPGLVGGHCIGVDPYYLTARAEELGYHPEVILAGRRINDGMPRYVVQQGIRLLAQRPGSIRAARIGLFGITYKENVPDLRNSKSLELITEMRDYGLNPMVCDPLADPAEARALGIVLQPAEALTALDMAIVAVPHRSLPEGRELISQLCADGILMDLKSAHSNLELGESMTYWSL